MSKGPLAASPVEYERLIAPIACTLLIACGLMVIGQGEVGAPDSCGQGPKILCDVSAQYAPSASFYADAGLRAPDSADDTDDDDDDVMGGDAAITVDLDQPAAHDVSVAIDQPRTAWITRTAEGYSLRGPPAIDQESTDLELLDDDDDDDDDLATVAIVAVTISLTFSASSFAGTPPAISSFSLSRAQRAPPISSL